MRVEHWPSFEHSDLESVILDEAAELFGEFLEFGSVSFYEHTHTLSELHHEKTWLFRFKNANTVVVIPSCPS